MLPEVVLGKGNSICDVRQCLSTKYIHKMKSLFYHHSLAWISHLDGTIGEFGGPSLAGTNKGNAKQWFEALLSASNPARVDAITFHNYASCRDPTAAGLESIFPSTVAQLSVLEVGWIEIRSRNSF